MFEYLNKRTYYISDRYIHAKLQSKFQDEFYCFAVNTTP